MAAVMALVFVPALLATYLMFGMASHGFSAANAIGAATFAALAAGMLAGLFRLARTWEDEEPS